MHNDVAALGSGSERERLARLFGDLVARAGAVAMTVFSRAEIAAQIKSDKSPVTEADEKVEEFLIDALARDLPGVPIVAEEAAARGVVVARSDAFLLIDPIDGTREFLARSTEFTINLAFIVDGAPAAGAISAPAQGRVWLAGARACQTEAAPGESLPPAQNWRLLRARKPPPEGFAALVSKSHLDPETLAFLAKIPIAQRVPVGSSLKFCALAEGRADVYPRFGPTMEWDTAAGDAILRAAGGAVLDPSGAPLVYNKVENNYRNGPFIAWGDPASATLS